MTNNSHIAVGKLGEDIACKYLEDRGFTILERNYRRKWGEIDIVSQKDSRTHFVEVKSVSGDTAVSPEENLHETKIKKLFRVFESYALDKGKSLHSERYDWQFDAIIVHITSHTQEARIKYIENIVIA